MANTVIDRKMALHVKMQTSWVLFKLVQKQASDALREVSRYEDAHGHGIEDFEDSEAYREAYTEFTETDEGFKRLWHRWNELFDEEMGHLKEFCDMVAEFTDGLIDQKTARQMATNPRYADRLEKVVLGIDE